MFAASVCCAIQKDIGEVVVGSSNGTPVRVKDIGTVEIGHAPRLGNFWI